MEESELAELLLSIMWRTARRKVRGGVALLILVMLLVVGELLMAAEAEVLLIIGLVIILFLLYNCISKNYIDLINNYSTAII